MTKRTKIRQNASRTIRTVDFVEFCRLNNLLFCQVSRPDKKGMNIMDTKQKELMLERLKSARLRTGRTQKQVGQSINVDSGTISNYETGKRLPSIDIICDLAKEYKVELGYLLGVDNSPLETATPKEINRIQFKYLIKGKFLDLSDLSDTRKLEMLDYYHFLKAKEMRERREKALTKK